MPPPSITWESRPSGAVSSREVTYVLCTYEHRLPSSGSRCGSYRILLVCGGVCYVCLSSFGFSLTSYLMYHESSKTSLDFFFQNNKTSFVLLKKICLINLQGLDSHLIHHNLQLKPKSTENDKECTYSTLAQED